MPEKVTKRDGTQQTFDDVKIRRALLLAFDAAGETDTTEITDMVADVVSAFECPVVHVEQVQDMIESCLMDYGYLGVLKAFVKYRLDHQLQHSILLVPDNSLLSDYVYMDKYAQFDKKLGRRLNYSEMCDRLFETHVEHLSSAAVGYPDPEALLEPIFEYIRTKRILPSMRSLQNAGKSLMANHVRMYNCSFVLMDTIDAFHDIMFLLLSQSGVGYNIQMHNVYRLPPIIKVNRSQVIHYNIDDSIEGWADAVDVLIRSYFYTNSPYSGKYIEFCYYHIRDEGAPLVTSGGYAPGHLGLKTALDNIRSVFEHNLKRGWLRPIDVHDINCHIASAVLSGGVRRSAMIALFDDTEMYHAKEDMSLTPHRAFANNSVVMKFDDHKTLKQVLQLSQLYGEPGFYRTNHFDYGCNPCGEVGLWGKEEGNNTVSFCNLVEINGSTCVNELDFIERCRVAAQLATIQSTYRDIRTLLPLHSDYNIGVSVTGIYDNVDLLAGRNTPKLLQAGHKAVVQSNTDMAGLLNISPAIPARTCCIKPSGTASLLLGCGSGIHPQYARRYYRRIIGLPNNALFKFFRKHNPHLIKQISIFPEQYLISFPVQVKGNASVKKDITWQDHLSTILMYHENWVSMKDWARFTHSVSATLSVPKDATDELLATLIDSSITSLAFVPDVDLSDIYPNAPLIPADGSWNTLVSKTKLIDYDDFVEVRDTTTLRQTSACEGTKCQISNIGGGDGS